MNINTYENFSKHLSTILIKKDLKNWQIYKHQTIDLILDGGAFSGSYLLGGLIYMQHISKYIHIQRISGTSIGSLFGLLYLSNLLTKYNCKFYQKFRKCFKKNGNLSVLKKCLLFIRKHISSDFYKQCNHKLYVTYFNVQTKKQTVRFNYFSNDDLLNSIYKSCFIPFIINGDIALDNKYVDGIVPYIFPKNSFSKIIFMDLHTSYLSKMINIKNEINNHSRILSGIFETHHFFMYGKSNLCFDIYSHFYYYKLIFYIRQTIAVKVVCIISIIINLVSKQNKQIDKINFQTLSISQLYYFIINYFMIHFKKILPPLLKLIVNSYLV